MSTNTVDLAVAEPLDGQVLTFVGAHLANLAAAEADKWEEVAKQRPEGPLAGAPDPMTIAKAYRRQAAKLRPVREDATR